VTPKQSDLYEFLKLWFSQHERGPSQHEIMAALHTKSRSSIEKCLRTLQALGVVECTPGKRRSLRLAEGLR
jgi:SOS-response transcriptional repressor LexA